MMYSFNGKKLNVPEQELTTLMTNLKITRMEALQVWLEDNGHLFNKEQEELEKKGNATKIERGVQKKRTSFTRERKTNENKVAIMDAIEKALTALEGVQELKTTKVEKEVSFVLNGESYSVSLVCHRKARA